MSFSSDARLAARFAARELRGGLAGFRILLACLALGVAAIAGVGSVRSAIEAGLAEEGAALLGGDAEVSFTYRFATDEERAWMEANALAVSEIADFRSMAVVERESGTERALAQIKAVDGAYPLVGEALLAGGMTLETALDCAPEPCVVAEALLTDRLGLEIGDEIRLGSKAFTLAAVLEREPDSATAGFAFAPPDECDVSSATRPSMNGDTRAAPYFFFNAPHTDAPRFAQIVGTLDTFPGSVAS